MIVLDTDHLNILQIGKGSTYEALAVRMDASVDQHFATTVATTIIDCPVLTDLLLQRLEASQVRLVSLIDCAGSFVGCGGFRTDQSIRATAAAGDVRQIAVALVDDVMQMPATFLTDREVMNGLVS